MIQIFDEQRRDCAATMIQCSFRQFLNRREQQRTMAIMQRDFAATVIQCSFRQFLNRREQQRTMATMQRNFAATAIQCSFRRFLCRREQQRMVAQFELECDAAIVIQTAWRSHSQRAAFLEIRKAAVVLQRAALKYLADKRGREATADAAAQHLAATTLQACWRGITQQQQFVALKTATIAMQKRARRAQFRRHQKIKSAVFLQAHWRGRCEYQRYQALKCATGVLQSCIRAKIKARILREEHRDLICYRTKQATMIQAAWRAYQAKVQFRTMQKAVVTIQRAVRAFQHQMCLSAAAVSMQATWKGKQQLCQYTTLKRSAVRMQRTYRLRVLKEKLRGYAAATAIQRVWRGHAQKLSFNATRNAVLFMQRAFRAQQLKKQGLEAQRLRCQAATAIQAAWRRRTQQTHYAAIRSAAILAQCCIRSFLVRKQIRRQAAAAVRVQALWRKFTLQRKFQRTRHSAVTVQRWYRRAANTKRENIRLQQAKAARLLQACYRGYAARKEFIAARSSAVRIQSAVRGWITRKHLSLDALKEQRAAAAGGIAALKIQSLFRGYRVRKQASKKVKAACTRVAVANANYDPANTLAARTKSALEILLTHKQLTFVLRACEDLEAACKLSASCCQRLVNANAVPILFQLIRSCNRSKPHMAVLCYALQILSHLSCCEKTAPVVFSDKESIALMAEILQMYRDKEDIFGAVVSILIKNCSHPEIVEKIKKNKLIVKRFAAILNLVERKMKLASKMKSAKSAGKGSKGGKGAAKGSDGVRNIETLKQFVEILQK